ncbi:MAG: four helix bundle suffix domain-containing protein [bacterium]
MEIFRKKSGYRWMDVYILANVVELGTCHFCKRFFTLQNDPGGRTFAQMTHAARSGCRNIAEGCERLTTSQASGIDLVNVAYASLCELRDDYNRWLMLDKQAPWATSSAEAQRIYAIRLDPAAYTEDINHACCLHILAQYEKFATCLDHADSRVRANTLLVLLQRTITMLENYIARLGKDFVEEGGFKERMSTVRSEARAHQEGVSEESPTCPLCGGDMRLRKTKDGARSFWGCTGYPACKGVVAFQKKCQ